MVYVGKYGWTFRDENLRINYLKSELKKNILKSLLCNKDCNSNYRLYFSKLFNNFEKKSCISFYRNSCIIRKTGKVVFKDLKLGRLMVKCYASEGFLVGLRKSSF